MDTKLNAKLAVAHKYYRDGRSANYDTQILLTQQNGYLEPDEGEKTYKVNQKQLKEIVPEYSSRHIFDLNLSFGPYELDYTMNGTNLLLGGRKGHIALMNWREAKLITEFHLKELVRDVKFLQNELLFAVAQRKGLYIYDSQGIEVHALKTHIEPQKLEYLPYHYLLVSANNHGFLKYLDISVGKPAAEHRFHFENVNDMKRNPWNGVICVGDARGIVSMWTPNINKPVVRLIAHNGPCKSLAIDSRGLYLATGGADCKVKIFDIRAIGNPLQEYWTEVPCNSLSISQSGLLSTSSLSEVKIWKDWQLEKQKSPYMSHICTSSIADTQFVPYEDFLGIGTANGFSNICIPGSGLANYDSNEANIFQTKRQRQEQEVHSLLEKLPPDTIVLNPHEIGTVDKASEEVLKAEEKAEIEEKERLENEKKKKKKKEKEKKKVKESVHTKKVREKIQDSLMEKKKDKLEQKEKMAKDIQFLMDATADLFDVPKKKKKITEE